MLLFIWLPVVSRKHIYTEEYSEENDYDNIGHMNDLDDYDVDAELDALDKRFRNKNSESGSYSESSSRGDEDISLKGLEIIPCNALFDKI